MNTNTSEKPKEIPKLDGEERNYLEVLLGIHDRHSSRLEKRMSFVWKISLAFWAPLAILLAKLLDKDLLQVAPAAHNCRARMLLTILSAPWFVLGLILMLGAYIGFVVITGKCNNQDRKIRKGFLTQVENYFPGKRSESGKKECWYCVYYSQVLQVVVAVVLTVAVILSLYCRMFTRN
jgi:hypothetical protein